MQRLLALREIDAAITSSFDRRFTLSMLLTQVTTSLGVDAADVLMLDPLLNTLDFVAGRGFDELPGHIAVPERLSRRRSSTGAPDAH